MVYEGHVARCLKSCQMPQRQHLQRPRVVRYLSPHSLHQPHLERQSLRCDLRRRAAVAAETGMQGDHLQRLQDHNHQPILDPKASMTLVDTALVAAALAQVEVLHRHHQGRPLRADPARLHHWGTVAKQQPPQELRAAQPHGQVSTMLVLRTRPPSDFQVRPPHCHHRLHNLGLVK